MAVDDILLLVLFCAFLFLTIYYCIGSSGSGLPTKWPLVGMMPALLPNVHRVHDFATEILKASGGTFEFKGSILNMDMLVTSDPANVHHILSKNFSNYPKGPEFKKIFDIFGDGIFNSDSHLWELHRKTTLSLLNHSTFHHSLLTTLSHKLESGLILVLDHFARLGLQVDLQELFQRFTFDNICILLLDHDPESLSIDFPYARSPCGQALVDAEEALLYRHVLPESFWKLQKRLRIGKEKKLSKAWETFDQFIYHCISLKNSQGSGEELDVLRAYVKAYEEEEGGHDHHQSGNQKRFLRDTLFNLMVAGTDTTSTTLTWFFWLLSKNTTAEEKIRQEIKTKLKGGEGDHKYCWRLFEVKDLKELVYLHGALCEALRLFPPIALEHKAPLGPDVLPSGHPVNENKRIVLSFYSMGRMETIWGKDCLEFKPERWISERGGIIHQPSFKFPAFNAGPRTCMGKEMSFIQMKTVAAAVLYNYQVHVGEGQPICPSDSIMLQMKHGLKVRITKRHV